MKGGSARAAMLCAVTARVFLGLVVDRPTTHNGAWLSALLGGLLAAPWVACICVAGRKKPFPPLRLALPALTAMDAATVFSALNRSAAYLALDRAPPLLLALPVAAALIWCVIKGGDAIGYAGMIAMRVAALLLLAVVLLQWKYYRPAWLSPVLGSGWGAIVQGGARTASWIIAASSLLAVSGDCRPLPALGSLAASIVAAVGLIALAGMMTPTAGGAWLNRLDSLLCNGRAPLYLQLPMIVLWFAGLLHLLAAECCAAAALLKKVAPIGEKLCALIVVGIVFALSRLEALPGVAVYLAEYGFPIVAAVTVLSMLVNCKGGFRSCEKKA